MIEKKYFKTKDYCKVKFSFASEGKKVELLGLNNDWRKPVLMAKDNNGFFTASVNLPIDSTHEFKYLVDKKAWFNDAETEQQATNVFGTTNSIVIL